MAAVTIRRGPKPFAWSYSKLKNFESCPKRHWHVDIAKDVKEEESEQLLWGNQVHKAMADRCGKGVPLTGGMEVFEPWAARVCDGEGTIQVEQKLAITKSFQKCGYFDNGVWLRIVADVIKINGVVALVPDWKTGKIVEDSQQLALTAACVFAHFPEIMGVRSEFIWLKEDAQTSETFKRPDMVTMWRNIWPRIEQLEKAHVDGNYPAKPGHLCKRWCPVRSCPHHGE
jgi:hypothetical protein